MKIYYKLLLTAALVLGTTFHTTLAAKFPAPQYLGNPLRMGHGIQRTMNLLGSSTPENRNTVRILFYGQSITAQSWWKPVAEDLRQRFPHADLIIKNLAIGGHSSQRLVKTAEADLYPFYPDLVIFHVYGSHIDYEKIIRRIRERTTAEILMQNDHVTREKDLTEEMDPAVLTPKDWNAFMNHRFLPQTALKYGAELLDQRGAWKPYLQDHDLNPAGLLKDNVHLNEHGCFLMAELVKAHLQLNSALDDGAWQQWVRTLEVGRDVKWAGDSLTLDFVGNRIDAVASSHTEKGKELEVWIDGKRPSEIPELRNFTRVSAFPRSDWPCLLQVQSEAPLLLEEWILTLNEVSDDLETLRFVLKGSKTGADGSGISTERFVSPSQRIVIEPGDWNLAYCRRVFKRGLQPGYTITWKVVPLYQDRFQPVTTTDPTVENVVTLAQGLSPGKHRLVLRGNSKVNLAALRVYCPPGMPDPEQTTYFVGPKGRDDNPGTEARPFASFQRAQQAVRSVRRAFPHRAVTVNVLTGRYELDAPLDFNAADSGASTLAPVTYQAAPGAQVEISGGQLIFGWQPDPQQPGLWRTRVKKLSSESPDSWRFEQLWVNGQRAIRARTPNWWEFDVLQGVTERPLAGVEGRFTHTFSAKPETLAWLNDLGPEALRDVQILAFHKWDTTREWLQSVTPSMGRFVTEGRKMKPWNPMTRNSLFFLENALAALDASGEWFLDRDGWLYYKPRPGEDMRRAEVIAPRIDGFLRIAGDIDNPTLRVRHLRFEGLKFKHAEFRIPAQGLGSWQAAMNVDAAAIHVDGARDIIFRDCAVEHIGSTAFWFRKACRDCRIERTRMFDLGISGVRIGEERKVSDRVLTHNITVDNCIIQSGGRIAPHAVGVWIGHSPDNAITHCDIADFFYTAVSVGWRWGYDESAAKRNRIEYNHLHHIGYRILSDMGGVYTLGPSEGTRVCYNVIHDVYSTRYGGWGLYPDEGSTGILYENNLVYDVRDGCVHQHYGKENVFRNNILAFSEEGQVAITRKEPHLSFTFENNIVVWDEGTLLGYNGWKRGAQVKLRNNLYWRLGGLPFDFAGKTWDEWRAAGNDAGSIIADPLFMDVENRDFRLRDKSIVEQIGFKPFDVTRAGVYGSKDWKKAASSLSYPEPYVVPPPEPITLHDTFNGGDLPSLLSLATLNHEGRKELIAVTGDIGPTPCLRIQDHPELKAVYNPHLYWDPQYIQGSAQLDYKIRLEPGAFVQCEWRNQGGSYRVGPSVQFKDGGIFVRGRKLMIMPEDKWIKVKMQTVLGRKNCTWQLQVTLPDGNSHVFEKLNCDPAWQSARWVGFISLSPGQRSFYLDDVVMENRDQIR